jgi:DNA-binding NtrC family response regulator
VQQVINLQGNLSAMMTHNAFPERYKALLIGCRPAVIEAARGVLSGRVAIELCDATPTTSLVDSLNGSHVLVLVGNVECRGGRETELLRTCRTRRIPVLFVTAPRDAVDHLRLMQLGALECLSDPLDLSRLRFLCELLTSHVPRVAPEPAEVPAVEFGQWVGNYFFCGGDGQDLLQRCRSVANLDATVLITGETGTGKTQLAEVIHALSPRRERPFVVVHCGSLSPSLLESELFGHVRGAFTHAVGDRRGRCSEAADGTLLLDEVDCLPLESQARLLRLLEERVFEPVGSNQFQRLEARIIAVSNRCLKDEMEAGRFRADLYYRLNVVSFHLAPLRERKEVVVPLATKFLADAAKRNGCQTPGLSRGAETALRAYDWPGNIRELRNVMEQALAFGCHRPVQLEQLPVEIRDITPTEVSVRVSGPPANALEAARVEAERQRLTRSLSRHQNNRKMAAADLGVSRTTLYKKLRQYGLT